LATSRMVWLINSPFRGNRIPECGEDGEACGRFGRTATSLSETGSHPAVEPIMLQRRMSWAKYRAPVPWRCQKAWQV